MCVSERIITAERRSPWAAGLVGVAGVLAVGMLDHVLGYGIRLGVFYLVPVAAVAWLAGRRWGAFVSVVAALMWLLSDLASRPARVHPLVPAWDALAGLCFFLLVTFALGELRSAVDTLAGLATHDGLTGVLNQRGFLDRAGLEWDRIQRYPHPVTIAFIDVDDLKTINDSAGHAAGDRALKSVAAAMRRLLRTPDVVGRLGGDEFCALMPETDSEAAAHVLSRLRKAIAEEGSSGRALSVSVGAVTCTSARCALQDALQSADRLMYRAKQSGKNAVHTAVVGPSAESRPSGHTNAGADCSAHPVATAHAP